MSIYETHVMKDPRLPFIFHRHFLPPNRPAKYYNWHENVELIYVTRGSGRLISDGNQLPLCEGDVAVINANTLHGFASIEDLRYLCLIIDRSFCLANHIDTNLIRFEPIFRDDEIGAQLAAYRDDLRLSPEDPAYVPTLRAHVLQILALLCRRHVLPEQASHAESHLLSCIKQAIGYIRSESHRDLSLDQVAGFVGLSKYYFAREFRRITGYSFITYLNLIRCEKAKALLSEGGASIGEIGRACGFANQSYFTRTFRAYTGRNPSSYREKKTKESSF